ncbi:uncharacterized protein LOC6585579 [Drosophila mojavensis]|uniref:DUF4777 domain-containing protein n=1 Tax=Drosophila mojavensis TaxID=7230 RepID=B4L6Q3_DROMO|nr:uncharacterized protein LOC6585579 [Drosophila mojavensis]EDW06049.1 uncharacterized protein Dmoj_GI16409 [Drosophila mojavensis]
MSKYRYGDLILEAFMEFRRPMALEEVIEYVAEMADKSVQDVRLSVDNTLTAAWLHGFVSRDNELYYLESIIKPDANETDEPCSTGYPTAFTSCSASIESRLSSSRVKNRRRRRS